MSSPTACTCDVCAAFPPPRRKPQPGKYGPPLAWRGRWYWLKPDGYYCNPKLGMLHRNVWEAHHGPVPSRHQIHHLDHDRGNNQADNLEALTPLEHEGKHQSPGRGFRSWSHGRRSEHSRDLWRNRAPRTVTCQECGSPFESTGMRAAYCSKPCRRRNYRRRQLAAD